jgi:hypothetical protein
MVANGFMLVKEILGILKEYFLGDGVIRAFEDWEGREDRGLPPRG